MWPAAFAADRLPGVKVREFNILMNGELLSKICNLYVWFVVLLIFSYY